MRSELRATLALALPLAAANLAQMAMAVTNTVMVGRLGARPLAAAGLGGMLYFTGGVTLQGVLSAVAPLAAHALGGGNRQVAGRIAGAGMALAVLLALPFIAVLISLDRLLAALGYDATLAAGIGQYLRAIAWGAPAFLGFAVLRSLLAALSHTRSVMAVVVICIAGNVLLNWVLIFGHLGAPALGMAGSGYASAINQWLMVAGLALCARIMPDLAALRVLRNAFAASRFEMAEILRLGLPIGGMRGIEVGVFMTAGILMGLLGPAALAAHQLVLNCAGTSFMVPLGLSQAVTVRVAYELGAGRTLAARRAGFVALALGIGFMSAAAVVLWSAPEAIIGAYIDVADPANRETVEIARHLIAIAAVFQVFPMLLATFGYWAVGFAGCWLLAFPLGYGAAGLWWGLALGLAVVAVMLTLRLHLLAPPINQIAEPVAVR
jgi:MATE family multidrug resistance protein